MRSLACLISDHRETALDITSISKRITRVIHVMQTFGVKPIIIDRGYAQALQESQRETRLTFSSENEIYHVGLEENVEHLVTDLVKKDDVQVVSITGMGGIGKTTLARHVFNHRKIRAHFKGFAWVCLSQQFTRKDVWQTILHSLRPMEYKESKKESELQEILYGMLATEGALIVLDDMWKEEHWDKIKYAFPPKKGGWKILLTCRNGGVALHVSPTSVIFQPKLLSPRESWRLFQRIAFPTNDTTDYKVDERMVKLGEKMVEYCGGLPLAVKVLGGLLATQYTLKDWERVLQNIGTNIMGGTGVDEDSNNMVYHVLSLSFEELPSYLKHCFLYLSHFPEDWAIDVEKLSYYCAAEGLSKPRGHEESTIRDDADFYIRELVRRNMVIAERNMNTSRYETCQLHDTMRELYLSKAKEEKFLQTVSARTRSSTTSSKSRRLAVHWSETFDGDREIQNPKLRSLLFVQEVKFPGLMETKISFTRLQLLRVLDLSRAGFKGWKLPSSIGKLIHLRYLSLYEAAVTQLPSWLCNLKQLLYLNLDVSLVTIMQAASQNVEQPL